MAAPQFIFIIIIFWPEQWVIRVFVISHAQTLWTVRLTFDTAISLYPCIVSTSLGTLQYAGMQISLSILLLFILGWGERGQPGSKQAVQSGTFYNPSVSLTSLATCRWCGTLSLSLSALPGWLTTMHIYICVCVCILPFISFWVGKGWWGRFPSIFSVLVFPQMMDRYLHIRTYIYTYTYTHIYICTM